MTDKSEYDEAVEAFKTLVAIKKQIISALQNEWDYSIRECRNISDFCHYDMSNNVEARESIEDSIQSDGQQTGQEGRQISLDSNCNADFSLPLLKWQSSEQQELERNWNSQLKKSIECLRKDVSNASKSNPVSMTEVEAIYQSIEQLKNAYFQVVEERDKNNKLWLRLKMYSHNRRETIEKVCKPYGSIKQVVDEMQRKGKPKEQSAQRTVKIVDRVDTYDVETNRYVERAVTEHSKARKPEDNGRAFNSQPDATMMANGPNLEEFVNQTNNMEDFYNAAMRIYSQYGEGRMTLKIFSNLVDYLISSLGIPSIDKALFKKIFDIYGIAAGTLITKEVFVMMYWEMAHVIRKAIEVMHSLNGNMMKPQMDTRPPDDPKTFVCITDYFEFKKKLYSGTSCTKFLATDLNTGELRVVDILHKSGKIPPYEQLAPEVARLAKLQRQNLALYLNTYHDLNNIYIISEFCSGGSLLHNISIRHENSYTMEFVHVVVAQLIEAVLYLHCNNIVHGSLTIDKVMLQENDYNHVKLRDAGLGGLIDVDMRGSKLTVICIAPEAKEGRVTLKSDIWSIGVILAFLVTGVAPVEGGTHQDYITAVNTHLKNGNVFKYDENLRDIVTKMISINPSDRPDAFQLITHPWYTHSGYAGHPPGYFKAMVQPIRRLIAIKQTHVDIIRVLEAQNALYVNNVPKLLDTIRMVKKVKNDTISGKDFTRIMLMQGLETQIVDNILMLILYGRDELSIETFENALIRWKYGVIALAWSEFHRIAQEDGRSMKAVDFARFLTGTRSQLLPREEVPRVCKNIAVDQHIMWTDFIHYLG